MRIGIIALPLDRQYAGIHYYVDALVKSLSKFDNSHEYIVIRDNNDPNLKLDQAILPTRGKNVLGFLTTVLKDIPQLAVKLNLDAVIEPAHFGPFNLPDNIKDITIVHDLTPITHSQWHGFVSTWGHKLFLKRILSKADLIVTNSNHTKEDIIKHLKLQSEKIVAAHLGVDALFQPKIDAKTLQRYGIVKDYFLYQGTIEPRKNLVRLVVAYSQYRDANPKKQIQLVLSGKKGWGYKPLLKAICKSLYYKDIIFLGYVRREDMPILYTSAQALLYPSLYEGFGMPIAEALACGTPVLCSNISSMPEVAGPHGIYVDPTDVDSITKGIEEVSVHSNQDREARILFAKKYNWDRMTQKIIRNITALTSPKHQPLP